MKRIQIVVEARVDAQDDRLCSTRCPHAHVTGRRQWVCRAFWYALNKPRGRPERCLPCVVAEIGNDMTPKGDRSR